MSESEYKKRQATQVFSDSEVESSDQEEGSSVEVTKPSSSKRAKKPNPPKKQPKKQSAKKGETSKSSTVSSELFGGEEDVQAPKTEPLWSSLSRQVAGGVLRQADQLVGEFFFDVRVFNTADIISVPSRERLDKSSAHLRLQVVPDDPLWALIKQVFKEGKKKFKKEAVFYSSIKK